MEKGVTNQNGVSFDTLNIGVSSNITEQNAISQDDNANTLSTAVNSVGVQDANTVVTVGAVNAALQHTDHQGEANFSTCGAVAEAPQHADRQDRDVEQEARADRLRKYLSSLKSDNSTFPVDEEQYCCAEKKNVHPELDPPCSAYTDQDKKEEQLHQAFNGAKRGKPLGICTHCKQRQRNTMCKLCGAIYVCNICVSKFKNCEYCQMAFEGIPINH